MGTQVKLPSLFISSTDVKKKMTRLELCEESRVFFFSTLEQVFVSWYFALGIVISFIMPENMTRCNPFALISRSQDFFDPLPDLRSGCAWKYVEFESKRARGRLPSWGDARLTLSLELGVHHWIVPHPFTWGCWILDKCFSSSGSSCSPPPRPLLWPTYTNLPVPGQATQDLATSMATIHKASAPGTGLSRPRYFYGPHTQILRSQDTPLKTSLLPWPPYTIFCSSNLSGLTFLIASHYCSPVWFSSFASQFGIEVLLLNLASHGWGSLDSKKLRSVRSIERKTCLTRGSWRFYQSAAHCQKNKDPDFRTFHFVQVFCRWRLCQHGPGRGGHRSQNSVAGISIDEANQGVIQKVDVSGLQKFAAGIEESCGVIVPASNNALRATSRRHLHTCTHGPWWCHESKKKQTTRLPKRENRSNSYVEDEMWCTAPSTCHKLRKWAHCCVENLPSVNRFASCLLILMWRCRFDCSKPIRTNNGSKIIFDFSCRASKSGSVLCWSLESRRPYLRK